MPGERRTSTEHSEQQVVNAKAADKFRTCRSAELLTASKLVELGFDIYLPFIDRSSVDLVSVWDEFCHRLQVKSRFHPRIPKGPVWGHDINVTGVTADSADTLIACVYWIPAYYIIPTIELNGANTLTLYPEGRSKRKPRRYWDEWRDRWDILKKAPTRTLTRT